MSDLALSHRVGVTEEATTGEVAYAGSPETVPGPYPEGLRSDGQWLAQLRLNAIWQLVAGE